MINGTYFKYNGFILLFEGGFMWGGKREGAGRKPIGTVRIRVPVDALEQVNEVIRAYKSGLMKSDPEIKVLKPDPEIKEAAKALQGLNSRTCKVLRKSFGTLFKAAELGVRVQPDGGLFVPDKLLHLFNVNQP
jgi:hypothetical protein